VADLSYEKLPIDVTMALDVSESVTGALLERLRRGVQQLEADLGARDRLKLMTFNMRVKRALDFGGPASSTDAAFGKIAAFGSTAVFDTLAVALATAAPADRRQLIVLFSDGHDTSSITDPATLIDVAQRTTATLGFVIPATLPGIAPGTRVIVTTPAGMDRSATAIYSQLAMETGGVVVRMLPGENLATTFRRVLDEFRSSYVLHFAPKGVVPGGQHTLDVRVKRSGVDVRARKSYVWR
jgi:VWFA-related protein